MGRCLAALLTAMVACAPSPSEPPDLPGESDGSLVFPDAEAPRADVTEGPDTAIPIPTFWRQVQPVLQKRCWSCHGSGMRPAGAPRIVDFADTQAASAVSDQTIVDRMGKRVLADDETPGDMPQVGSMEAARMTLVERRIIRDWANAGAPEGPRPDGGMGAPEDAGTGEDALAGD